MAAITIIVPGVAVGKPAPRVGLGGRIYTPSKGQEWMARVQQAALPLAPPAPWDGPVGLDILVERAPLKSFSRRQLERALCGWLLPDTKPDADNYSKGVADALSGVIFRDDAQVVDLRVRKRFAENPRTVVTVTRLGVDVVRGREAGGVEDVGAGAEGLR